MFRKLIALDWKMYHRIVRSALVIYAVILFSGVTFQLIQIPLVSAISSAISCAATILMIPAAIILGLIHYYRHLYSRQGYLTQTLPVTPGQRYRAKFISSFSLYLLASAAALAGAVLLIWSAGNLQDTITQYRQYVITFSYTVGVQEEVTYLMLFGIWFWIFFSGFSLYSFCITMGMGRKFETFGLGGPVIVYIVTYFVSQILVILGYSFIPLSLHFNQRAEPSLVFELPTNVFQYIRFGENMGWSEMMERSGGTFKMGLGMLIIILITALAEYLIAQRQMKDINLR